MAFGIAQVGLPISSKKKSIILKFTESLNCFKAWRDHCFGAIQKTFQISLNEKNEDNPCSKLSFTEKLLREDSTFYHIYYWDPI